MIIGQGDPDGQNKFTDSNGRGGFRFEPPSGFLSLCTANMSDATYAPIGPTSIEGTPDQHFDTVLYTGNAKARRIGGLNFQPDFVWQKTRSASQNHFLYDSLRGATKNLRSNVANAEATNDGVESFNSDGFSVGGTYDSKENRRVIDMNSANCGCQVSATFDAEDTFDCDCLFCWYSVN